VFAVTTTVTRLLSWLLLAAVLTSLLLLTGLLSALLLLLTRLLLAAVLAAALLGILAHGLLRVGPAQESKSGGRHCSGSQICGIPVNDFRQARKNQYFYTAKLGSNTSGARNLYYNTVIAYRGSAQTLL
jgi:hypothetical protein